MGKDGGGEKSHGVCVMMIMWIHELNEKANEFVKSGQSIVLFLGCVLIHGSC